MQRTQFMLPPKLHAQLKAAADAEGVSMAEIVRRVMSEWLKANAPKK